MFYRIGHFIARRRAWVLIASLIITVISGLLGVQSLSKLSSGGFSDPKSDSAKALEYTQDVFKTRNPAVVLIVDAPTTVDDPTVTQNALAIEKQVAAEAGVDQTLSYWSSGGAPQLKSADGKAAFIFVYFKGKSFDKASELGGRIQKNFDKEFGDLRVYASGIATFSHEINNRIRKDLARSEYIAIPLTMILLLLVFGALTASLSPLLVGVAAIAGAFFILWLITLTTDISIFALNLITGLGLGLGIDYSLLIVNRFREELRNGNDVSAAVARTVATAGKTVVFSGLTVAVTLASLILFPMFFLSSFAYAGVAVVLVAVLGALIPLPALLALLGPKIDTIVIRKSALNPTDHGNWARLSRIVMRWPVPITVITGALLLFLAAPTTSAAFSQVDERVLPASSSVAQAAALITDRFPGKEASPVEVIIPNSADKDIAPYMSELAKVDQVVRVNPPTTVDNNTRIQVIASADPRSPNGERLIKDIRAVPAPEGTLVGGIAADYTDSQNAIARTLPWVFLWIVISVLILLFLFTGSILLPIKAVLLNILSLGATLGVLTWIFVEGHLQSLIGGFTVTGTLDTSTMVLIAVVAFGLSMDYEIFLLSRIKEEHDRGASNEDAVAFGLQRSGRIITAAALILTAVFAAFLISGVTSIKMMGLGVAFAILLDATVIRALLVPALMRLFGSWNWWAPRWMKRFSVSH